MQAVMHTIQPIVCFAPVAEVGRGGMQALTYFWPLSQEKQQYSVSVKDIWTGKDATAEYTVPLKMVWPIFGPQMGAKIAKGSMHWHAKGKG